MKRILYIIVQVILGSAFSLYGVNGPKIIYPAENIFISKLDPTFTWKFGGTQADLKYEVRIAEDQNFTQNVITLRTSTPSLHLSIPYLKPNTPYYWTVRATWSQNQMVIQTRWSHEKKKNTSLFRFTTTPDASGFVGYTPEIVQPSANAALTSLQPRFIWKYPDHKDAQFEIFNTKSEWISPWIAGIMYTLQLSSSKNFESDVKEFKISDSTSYQLTIPFLRKNSKYYWRVKAAYNDPEKNIAKESGWTIAGTGENNFPGFTTAENATGNFTFNEGAKEEVFDEFKLASAVRLTVGTNNSFAPAISMDGKKLAFCSDRDGQIELYVKLLDERIGSGETRKTVSTKGISNYNPFWLMNNEETGFYSNRYNIESIWEVFSTTKGTGTSVTFQTNRMEMEENPRNFNLFGSCSIDNKIVFTGKFRNSNIYRLFLKDLQDNSITELRPGLFPCINNYDKIVFSTAEGDGDYEIMVVELEGHSLNNPSILAPNEASDYDPSFSPDGSRIVFTSTRSGNSDLWVMNSDGTGIRQLTFHPLVDRRPQWIDNVTIVFQSNRIVNNDNKPTWNIYKMDVPKE